MIAEFTVRRVTRIENEWWNVVMTSHQWRHQHMMSLYERHCTKFCSKHLAASYDMFLCWIIFKFEFFCGTFFFSNFLISVYTTGNIFVLFFYVLIMNGTTKKTNGDTIEV